MLALLVLLDPPGLAQVLGVGVRVSELELDQETAAALAVVERAQRGLRG